MALSSSTKPVDVATRAAAQDFLSTCGQAIEKAWQDLAFPASPSSLYEPMCYALQQGGKRLRPLFTLLSYGLFQEQVAPVLRPALAVELFHNFTLMHDDVMDQAPLRRGKPSVQAQWNTNTAILAGDATLIEGYKLLSEVPPPVLPKVLHMFSESAMRVCEGQQLDLDFETQDPISESSYLNMVRLKTGCLLGCCFALGALIAGASPSQVARLQGLGEQIGIIFQLKDDLLDVYGQRQAFGKRAGGDIISNKKTFLLIKATQKAQKEDLAALRSWLKAKNFQAKEKIKAITALYNKLQIPKEVTEKIQTLHHRCCTEIAALEAPPSRKKALHILLEQLTQRSQ